MGLEGSKGLEAVIREIREKGRKEAEKIRAETQADVEAILRDAQSRAAEIKMAAKEEADRAATHIINQEVSAAKLVVKRQVLNAQKTLLDQVYSASLAAIADLPAEFHKEALTELLKRVAGEIREGVVHANERDTPVVKEIISQQKALSGYTVGAPVDIPGGIIVESRDGELLVDYSYRTFLDEIWESSLKDVSDILFT
ncbi:MAG TPA: V-type ATP synthase subunit E family protein [Candidatus Methanoculleus thermohydrogenotrophicum]|nr:V-type ATP synthase subunit E family protein [Candidatus Methanoculleus thermohydrogenotrophicum]NLM81118.1 V-type ATP synthase subunit E [Candidatus Methanoculleus thermohydrogenotrophicum]HOB17135.1 V-type ATP synthase subunit E family protein [Candidatus Methanoculleus thermohydrogenotrophicum]HPZ37215.1 V-type ATP synthase subunit E family protein [Candidatus Methanoculleus thermohydrogenotrophicum]HQC90570.1 V-type ATP synthase subunit E family protein [Candidatus Methanoculleus thermoh